MQYEIKNIDINKKGNISVRKRWITFKGMVYRLKLINKRFKKFDLSGDFTVRLPLK